jgi:hypothetical protein
MKKVMFWVVIGLVVLLLAACAPAAVPEPTPTLAPADTNTPPPPTDTPEPTPTDTPEPTPTEIVVVDYCIECHTDKDQLILTAKIEEEVEEESEGVG